MDGITLARMQARKLYFPLADLPSTSSNSSKAVQARVRVGIPAKPACADAGRVPFLGCTKRAPAWPTYPAWPMSSRMTVRTTTSHTHASHTSLPTTS